MTNQPATSKAHLRPEECLITVVDDDARMRESLQDLLESSGYRVLTYASAETLLTNLEPSLVHCLITDIGLPGVDGFGLVSTLTQRGPCPPTIMITGLETEKTRIAFAKSGARALFGKPFDPVALLEAVRQACLG